MPSKFRGMMLTGGVFLFDGVFFFFFFFYGFGSFLTFYGVLKRFYFLFVCASGGAFSFCRGFFFFCFLTVLDLIERVMEFESQFISIALLKLMFLVDFKQENNHHTSLGSNVSD